MTVTHILSDLNLAFGDVLVVLSAYLNSRPDWLEASFADLVLCCDENHYFLFTFDRMQFVIA